MKKVIWTIIALAVFIMSGCSNSYESFGEKVQEGDYEAAAKIYASKIQKSKELDKKVVNDISIMLFQAHRKYTKGGDPETFYKIANGVMQIKGDMFIKNANAEIARLYAFLDWQKKVVQQDWDISIKDSSSNSSTCELWFNYISGFIDDIPLLHTDLDIDEENKTITYEDDDLMVEVAYAELDSKYVIVNVNKMEAIDNDNYIKLKSFDQVSDDIVLYMGFVKLNDLASIIGSIEKITDKELVETSQILMDVKPVGKGSVTSWRGLDQLNGYRYMIIDNSIHDDFDITPDSEYEVKVLYVEENKEKNRIYDGKWKVNQLPEAF